MSVFDVDWENIVENLLPPDKRTPVRIAFLVAYTKRIAVDASIYFEQYKQGSNDPLYAPGTYARREVVVYNSVVYQSLYDDNTALPTDPTMWRQIAPSFIGVDQRLAFRCQKIIVEYALNKRFSTVFRQPPGVSDIYITSNALADAVFIIGYSEDESSDIFSDRGDSFIINSYTFELQFGYTINIPTAVYNSLGVAKESIIRAFADLYTAAGITYEIQPY